MYLAGFFSEKIRKTATGQKKMMDFIFSNPPPFENRKVVWMHCASLGEFEQGRSILEKLKSKKPEIKIALSFFSSSGYDIRCQWPGADFVFYLPKDSPSNARKLIQWLKPDMCILVKYDFWWNHLSVLRAEGIPVYLVAAHFEKKRYFFREPFMSILTSWNQIFTMRASSEKVLHSSGIHRVQTAGDPRLDRVVSIREQGFSLPDKLLHALSVHNRIYVYGSVYSSDMDVICASILKRPNVFHVVVPHDVRSTSVELVSRSLRGDFDTYSKGLSGKNILVIDEVGFLAGIYAKACFVYIGGGFGRGIHNILEPSVYGIPVMFGPNYQSFPEAVELIQQGICFSIQNQEDFERKLSALESNPRNELASSSQIPDYFKNQAGATEKIISFILKENFSE